MVQKSTNLAQLTRRPGVRSNIDQDRVFDKTSLTSAAYGSCVHRDYAAHFFRWGFASRFINRTKDVLEVGCGVDLSLVKVLRGNTHTVPRSYLGVDLNKIKKKPSSKWAQFKDDFDFVNHHDEIKGSFDVEVCFEVIEHMRPPEGQRLLQGLHRLLKPKVGLLLLSTPVFNGKRAANHLHEYTITELQQKILKANFLIEKRFGTFASYPELKPALAPEHRALYERLMDYYSHDVLSCFLAPIYPDHSRNNVWLLRRD